MDIKQNMIKAEVHWLQRNDLTGLDYWRVDHAEPILLSSIPLGQHVPYQSVYQITRLQ